MAIVDTKIVDKNGKRYRLPNHMPDEMADEVGIPLDFSLAGVYPEPFASELEEQLALRGIETERDILTAQKSSIRQAIQAVLQLEVKRIQDFARQVEKEQHS